MCLLITVWHQLILEEKVISLKNLKKTQKKQAFLHHLFWSKIYNL